MGLMSDTWHIYVKYDREKVAVLNPDGFFEFNVIDFVLCNVLATFQQKVNIVLHGFKWYIYIYCLDDVIVFSSTLQERLQQLEKVLQCLRTAGLHFNSKKYRLGIQELHMLGHLVDSQGERPNEKEICAAATFHTPSTSKQFQSFLGLSSYFRCFYKRFSELVEPLTHVFRKYIFCRG